MSEMLFSEAEIESRFADFYDIGGQFCDAYNKASSIAAEIDPERLYVCVVAIYDDIARYKMYHLTDPRHKKSNPIKRAAYGIKWITKFSPIVFPTNGHISGQSAFNGNGILVNAMFALHFSLINLREHSGVVFNLNTERYYELLYDLTYRDISADAMVLYFDAISAIAKSGSMSEVIVV